MEVGLATREVCSVRVDVEDAFALRLSSPGRGAIPTALQELRLSGLVEKATEQVNSAPASLNAPQRVVPHSIGPDRFFASPPHGLRASLVEGTCVPRSSGRSLSVRARSGELQKAYEETRPIAYLLCSIVGRFQYRAWTFLRAEGVRTTVDADASPRTDGFQRKSVNTAGAYRVAIDRALPVKKVTRDWRAAR